MTAALEFERLTKEYRSWTGRRRLCALDSFSLRVEPGEIFGFLGPNGAGKTTAIHLAMGFMRPTRGQGRMLGRPFGDAQTRRQVGFLAENIAFYPRRAESLVRFYGALNSAGGPALRSRTREVLAEVGMTDRAGDNVGRFSRGMLQRIGLAQALVNDPQLLVLDEPTSALDPLGRVLVRELLQRARDEGKTVFLSSHLLSEVELICDRVAVVNRGRLVRLGTISQLLESKGAVRIVASKISPGEFSGAQAHEAGVAFQVPAGYQRQALEKIWALGGEVVSVNPVRRSLEELFLEVTADPADAPREGLP